LTSRVPRILLVLVALALLSSLVGCGGGVSSTRGWVIDATLFTPNYVPVLDGALYHWDHLPMTARFELPRNWVANYGTVQYDGAGEWNGELQMIRVVTSPSADVTVRFVDQSELGGSTYGRTSFNFFSDSGTMFTATIKIAISDSEGPTAPVDIQALIAHELGHALGIGGHSPNNNDLMYTTHIFGRAQVATILDVNTCKTAYPNYFGIPMLMQRPTRGGNIETRVIE